VTAAVAEMSVIVVTDTMPAACELLAALRAQTARDRLELVLVVPSRGVVGDGGDANDGFAAFKVVEVGCVDSLPYARAAGIRAARAPVVAITETHSFPEPDWAAALLECHADEPAAVGPSFENANPGLRRSWANFYLDYGRWAAPADGGPLDDLPGHNSSYRRDLLLELYGDHLELWLRAEVAMHADLCRRGYEIVLAPTAVTRHLNVTAGSSWLRERVHAGRQYAGARARAWPAWRRAVYAGGSILIPAVRLPRIARDFERTGRRPLLRYALPALTCALAAQSAGEALGYAAGDGAAIERLADLELHRFEHLAPSDPGHVAAPVR
jgi:hypothetical protein